MSHFEPTADQSKWQHDQLTRHIATSIQIENGQLTGYHQNGSYINRNGLFRPTEITSEFDTVEKKPEISWNPEKVWAAENGMLTKLSPSDQGIVRSATPSANSTESAPSSVRHSIGPEESESTEDPESKSSRTETPEEKPNIERLQNATEEASNLLMNFKRSEDNGTNHLDIEKNLLLAMQMEKQLLREKIIDNSSTNLSSSTAESITNVVNAVATADFEIDYQPQPTLPSKTQSPANPPRSRGYCRPPGLGGPSEPTQNGNGKVFICSICSFSCPSKFHYNSHMNTHGDHRCSMCDYTARTEGRMRKHMKDSHTREEQLAVGLDFSNDNSKSPQKNSTTLTSSMASDISSTMNSIMEMANRVANGSAENGGLGTGFPSALESIKAFAEGGSEGLANFLLPRPPSENGFESAGPSNGRDPPRRSSGGKPKKYPCKQCPHISTTKDEVWSHMKSHIPVEKQLCCPQCDFVTEYKHHLEYHTRNHFSMRPFKCNKCNYSCVNKSMLNSHMKSHSNQYQFQCQDCNYQSKYCHSLKMHLRKYSHNRKPGVTMDVDDAEEAMLNDPSLEDPGSVASSNHENQMNTPTTPVTTSSVTTLSSTFGSSLLQPLPSTSTVQYANFLRQKQEEMNETMRNRQMLNCTVCDHTCQTVDQMLQHNLIHLQQNPQPPTNFNAIFQYLSNNMNGLVPPTISTSGTSTLNLGNTISSLGFNPSELLLQVQKEQEKESSPIELETIKQEIERTPTPGPSSNEDSPLSAERSSTSPIDPNRETSSTGSANSSPRKRKCKPSEKLDEISQRLQIKNSPEHNYETTTIPQPIPISAFRQPFLDRAPILPSYINNCSYCRISFDDVALFNIHRGYHGFDNPFKCNRCGEIFDSSMEFNLHLWREKHD